MVKETESMDKLVVLYTIDTDYQISIKVITDEEFYAIHKEA